jgi:hypothetical protein
VAACVFALAAFGLSRLTELYVYCAEDAVYEFAGRISAESLGELYRFVYRYFCRHLRAVRKKKLRKAEAKDIAVNGGDLFERPLRRGFYDDFVYFDCFAIASAGDFS